MHIKQEELNRLLLHSLKALYHYEQNEIAEYSLTFQEVYALQFLKEGGRCSIRRIAEELRIKHFTASRLVSRLEQKGHVLKQQDPTDRRVFSADITSQGISIIETLEQKHSAKILKNLENNPEIDIDNLIKAARNIHKILGVKYERAEG